MWIGYSPHGVKPVAYYRLTTGRISMSRCAAAAALNPLVNVRRIFLDY